MDKKTKIYAVLFVLLIFGYIYLESTKKQPINWFPSFVAKHKIPLGTYVLNKELSSIFPSNNIETVAIPPYVYLQDSTRTGTYFFVDEALNFGDAEFLRLLKFVARGNDVFISTHGMNIDTLNFETERLVSKNLDEKVFFKQLNKAFKGIEYSYDRPFINQVFTKIDTLNTTVLGITGYINANEERTEEGINFVKHSYGKGNFYLHTFPEVFTNYNTLHEINHQHTANILSYLREDIPILWDAYYKTGKSKITSPLQYLLGSKHLKWAYYMALIGILVFVIFEGKRKQRSIPIITPLKNQTVAFTRTIANMYFEKQEHKNIAEHKISYLLEFIRVKLHIQTIKIDAVFYENVALRSGNSLEDVEKLFKFCDAIHLKNQITNEELIKLNSLIEKFKKTIQYGK
ncbi:MULTISPECIES: DUF4350 domain-containing protein [Flavobacteriaceae]|uniref:DUF4350 domain-containing protein n=1 Tax=Lutibacter litoralis TaxID=321268 RepID=A0ABV5K672_9FLAO|nr:MULTISPECIES: DUF4350 domain-containing protein [Flavobacteriaceae]GGK58947.1 hypothetical protein GCM10007963_28880 [Lutibacter litoralis]